jgi:small subunit ribosomal protein S1
MDNQLENRGVGTIETIETKPETTMDSLEDYEKSFRNINRGDYLSGKVVKIENDGVYVDIGWKREGYIPMNQLSHKADAKADDEVKLGEEVPVIVLKVDDMEGELILSKKRADLESAWHKVTKAHENGEVITATVVEAVKGGLLVDLGLRGFVPASQVDIRPVRDLEEFVGEALNLRVIELDQARRKVVLSRKKVIEEEKLHAKEKTMGTLYEGQIVKGKVARLTNFGAFINLGGIDGLVHISEMAWKRIKHPSEVIRIGEDIDVMILKVDEQNERISLSRRQAMPDPWSVAADTITPNSIIKGKVSKIAKKYVFVEVLDGVEGVIPINELTEDRSVKPEDILKEGQEIDVKVLNMQCEARRMLLSIKQASGEGSRSDISKYTGKSNDTGSAASIGDILKAKMQEENKTEKQAPETKAKVTEPTEKVPEPVVISESKTEKTVKTETPEPESEIELSVEVESVTAVKVEASEKVQPEKDEKVEIVIENAVEEVIEEAVEEIQPIQKLPLDSFFELEEENSEILDVSDDEDEEDLFVTDN